MTPEEAIKELRLFVDHKAYTDDFQDMCRTAIAALEKQIPKKPYQDNENGVHEKDYCPTCHRSLFPYDHHCRCGQAIDWTDWEK